MHDTKSAIHLVVYIKRPEHNCTFWSKNGPRVLQHRCMKSSTSRVIKKRIKYGFGDRKCKFNFWPHHLLAMCI
jgi:hypothetical protein